MPPPALVALDLDGTCVRYEPRFEMDPVVVEALGGVRAAGGRWLMNSDRPVEHMRDLALALPEDLRPDALLARQRTIHWREDGDYRPHEPWNGEELALHASLWLSLQPHFEAWRKGIEAEHEVLEAYTDGEVFAFRVPAGEIARLRDRMAGLVAPWSDAQVSGNEEWSFVLHSRFSKRRVLAEAARVLGIPPERILAIGDGLNDLTMLDGGFTPLVGCPADACEPVRRAVASAGGTVASRPKGAGTAEILLAAFPR